jgi:predicted  nucleic acid-binding Zn-ribbon protein
VNVQNCAKCGKRFDNVHGKCPTCGWESLDNPHDVTELAENQLSMDEVVDLIDALEGEVNNGGFHQYFYNSAGDRTAEAIQALEIVGAFAMADIVKKAAQKFPFGMPPKGRFERQDVLLEAYPNAAAFRALDEEFYRYPDNLAALIATYKSSV